MLAGIVPLRYVLTRHMVLMERSAIAVDMDTRKKRNSLCIDLCIFRNAFTIIYKIMIIIVYSLESLRLGDSNVYTTYIFMIKYDTFPVTSLNVVFSSYLLLTKSARLKKRIDMTVDI